MLDQLADPLSIGDIGLAAGDVAQVLGIQKPALAVLLEHVEDRLPVAAGRLHADQRHPVARQPVEQPEQSGGGGRETPHLLVTSPPLARHPHAGHDRVPVDVQAGAALDQCVHRSSLSLAGRSPPGGASRSRIWGSCSRQQSQVPEAPTPYSAPGFTHQDHPASARRRAHFHASRAAPPGAIITQPRVAGNDGRGASVRVCWRPEG